MSDECRGCREYDQLSRQLTRRNFVGMGAGLAAAAAVPAWLPRVVLADSENSSRDVLVAIFMRGGADSLSLCVPYAEPNYYRLRPTIAIPPPDSSDPNRALRLNGRFGFPPAFEPLMAAYNNDDLLVVHACGLPSSTRSHFAAMHNMEVGQDEPPANLFSGWLGRHLQVTAPTAESGVLRAVGLGFGLQRSLAGAPKTLPISDLANFGLEGNGSTESERRLALSNMYRRFDEPLKTAARTTFDTINLLNRIGFDGYQPAAGAEYPENAFGYALRTTAALIKAQLGVEAIAIDIGGWDTHDNQGPTDGRMNALMQGFARSLGAFHADLEGDSVNNVTTITTSEFGRNAFENGSAGTDHGHGGLMLVLGDGIRGGRVLTDWPGLENDELYDGQDLQITIDYRDILTEILTQRLDNPNFRGVFGDPSFNPRNRRVTRPSTASASRRL